jgi:hypothetical protein
MATNVAWNKTNRLWLLGDWIKKANEVQQEVGDASQQEKPNNDTFPHAVMIPHSNASPDLNMPPKYPLRINTLDGNIHNGMK